MTGVEKRVVARIKQETKELHAEDVKLNRRKVVVEREAAKIREGVESTFQALANGSVLTATQTKHVAACTRLPRAARDMSKINERRVQLSATLKVLDTPTERARRMKEAEELGVTDQPIPGPEAAKMVLVRAGKPMHVQDITRAMLESGTVKLSGKTPEQTVSAYLAKLAKRGDTFVRVAPGVFRLKDNGKAKKDNGKAKDASEAAA